MNPPLATMLSPGLAADVLLREIYTGVRDFAIFTMDTAGNVTSWNIGAELILGFAAKDIIGQSCDLVFTPEDVQIGQSGRERQIAMETGRAADFRWHLRSDGTRFWADGVLTPVHDNGQVLGFLKILRDITERKLAQDEIQRLASIDLLTGLLNRASFDARRSEMVSLADRSGHLLLLMVIDLDQFKEVNDLLGHQAGDLLLKHVAQRIRNISRESDVTARLGGDEFGLLQLYAPAPSNGGLLAEKLLAALSQPFQLGEREVRISASIGLAVCPLDAATPDDLLHKADLALYHAKRSGRNCFHFYTEELDAMAHRKSADHIALRCALAQGSFWIAYQPIIDAVSGRTLAVEALLRVPGKLGARGADYVIGLAQEINVLPELGSKIVHEACAQLRSWRDLGLGSLRMCINTCAQELLALDYMGQFEQALAAFQLQPDDIEIELTERDAIYLERSGSTVISRMRQRGFALALDDFGTG
ncbi:MAG: diguanylate cyclase, partial [Duganella sp.]